MRLENKNRVLVGGFTLVESLVAVAVFAVVTTAIVGLFLEILRLDQKSRAVRLVEQNTRFLSEFITREIRNGVLDYDAYGGSLATSVSTLNLLNKEGEREAISLMGTAPNRVLLTIGSSSSQITSADVGVSNLFFYINPQDPLANVQPRVTFTFTMSSNLGGRPEEQAQLIYQSTVSLRDY